NRRSAAGRRGVEHMSFECFEPVLEVLTYLSLAILDDMQDAYAHPPPCWPQAEGPRNNADIVKGSPEQL
ncbi:hypothetical protein ACFLX5_05850, partial [Chloroflexota bacterium]